MFDWSMTNPANLDSLSVLKTHERPIPLLGVVLCNYVYDMRNETCKPAWNAR